MDRSNKRILRLTELGQSLWLDNITRSLIVSGDLAALIERGDIRGVTSNPTIFNHAISKSGDYDNAINPLAWAGWDAERIFWRLAVEDITAACDLFRPVYERTDGADGFVSLEVSPLKAHDTEGTIAQVKELWQEVNRPNLMIKIPATPEGIPAIRECLEAGLNINITLIFSRARYAEVMEAYLSALEARVRADDAISSISSVASFFVSRIDTKVDGRLPQDSALRGRAGIANAKLAYRDFEEVFGGDRFLRLSEEHGARVQRPLWASTSTKNPAYPDTLYADNLIGPHTVDTVPPQTLDAFRDHGRAELSITQGVEEAALCLDELEAAGISMDLVTKELEDEGVASFAASFDGLIGSIEDRRGTAVRRLGTLAEPVSRQIGALDEQAAASRLHGGDATLWTADPAGQAEVAIRLGWLELPESSSTLLPELTEFSAQVAKLGYSHALLLGMGGSSLAPEVISRIFAPPEDRGMPGLSLSVLDSTDPGQIMAAERNVPLDKTLFILSSKSGGTAEVLALFDYFWKRVGEDGAQWIAITDPGTPLEKLAREKDFLHLFLANPDVGGRYSALTAFGLVPAALAGVDVRRFLADARPCRLREILGWLSARCLVRQRLKAAISSRS
jgi:transaldolase/glucose-6-phosphate isomerase